MYQHAREMPKGMKTQKIRFPGSQGYELSARLDLPGDTEPQAYALFAHCFTCTKNFKAVYHISRGMVEEKIALLRFDFTGLGESEGDFADTTFSSNIQDLLAAADFMEKEYKAPKILMGHSLGGAAVLQAARSISSCVAVATIAAQADLSPLTQLLNQSDLDEKGEAEITIAGRSFRLKKQFLDDLEEVNMQKSIRSLDRALLIFHSPADELVDIENASRIFKAARHPKSFVSLDRADHLLSDERDSKYVGALTAVWAGHYLARS
jgi:alpha/beta superfamily hydrolase